MARQRLETDGYLSHCTNLEVDVIISLSLCLFTTYFSFQGVTYRQIYGTAMGSLVSVVVANPVTEYVEEALVTFPGKISFSKGYVDDVCSNNVTPLLLHLNGTEPSIQLTHERDHCLPFRDIELKHNPDGSISTVVYWNPKFYLDFASHHPFIHKAAAVKTLFSCAKSLRY